MKSRTIPLLIALFTASAVEAKPLYITVPKSFGSQEAPTFDVAFAGKAPVELRVLKPKDLELYIKEQANLRRAYSEPASMVNPGRYLARGLNAVDNPGSFLLDSMDVEFRRALVPVLPPRVGQPRKVASLAEGAKRLIGIPPGMELVRSEWLNLDLGGADRGFDVPGFDEWSSDSSGFEERRVALQPLPPGIYVLQVVQDRVEGQVTLVVSDLTVQLKQTDGEILVRVAGRDQNPRPGASIKVHLSGGKGPQGKTDEKGEVRLEVSEPRLLVTAQSGADVAIVDTDFYSSLAVTPDLFLYTDRPIYKPGDEVRFRGLVRKPASFLAQLFAPRERRVTVRLRDRNGEDDTTSAEVDEFGSFAGKLSVSEGRDTSVVQVVAELDDRPYQSEARVQAYVKPTFYLEMELEQDSVKPGDTVTARMKARRYAGGVPDGTRYEFFLYRTVLDTPAWVDDAGMGGQGSSVTYGSASTTEGKLSVPERLYSSVEQRSDQSDFDPSNSWATARELDAQGEASISVKIPELSAEEKARRTPFKYTLTVRAQDPEATTAAASKILYYGECAVRGQLRASKSFVTVGGEATLVVRALTLGGRSYGATSGDVRYVLVDAEGDERELAKKPFRTGDDGFWRDTWPTAKVGAVVARVSLADKQGQTDASETRLLVLGMSGEPVARVPILTVEALPEPVAPGDKARFIALFPESWGPSNSSAGSVWITTTGSGIFDTKLVRVQGTSLVHELPIERRFGSAVYASIAYPTASGRWDERTLAFRIVPKERTLSVRVEPVRSELSPLSEQTLRLRVSDHRGEGVVAQLSVGVVDKAIYALQSELRPHVLEFFYPLTRNNVASFYSSEFQGYGYGEYLARLRGRIRAHEFAAVKPPTVKPKDEDTAYWNPAIVTDADGTATVSFKMPGNSTLWTVTAVAADTSGRFGEGNGEFATRGSMVMAASLPQFLRAGDKAQGSVRLAKGKGDKAKTVSLAVEATAALEPQKVEQQLQLEAKGEKIVTVALNAASAGIGSVEIKVTSDGELKTDRREVPVRSAAMREKVVVSRYGGGKLELPLAKGATVEGIELSLMPSTVAASLATVEELLDYPYGCLEQLVSTTVPNVAVYRTLKQVGAFGKLDPESQALLEQAYSRAVSGVGRILALSTKGGGFTWFGGYDEPSLPLTLIAVDGLTYAAEAGLVERGDPRLARAAQYLAAAADLPPVLDATRTYVLARLSGEKEAPRVRALLDAASGGDMYVVALGILAAEHAGIAAESGIAARVAALAEESSRNLVKTADYRFDEAFGRYPLSRVGLTAVLTHAASFGKLDRNTARERLVTALASGPALSTFDRSTLLLHSLWLLEEDAKAMRQMQAPEVEGRGVEKVSFEPRGAGLIADLGAGATSVEVGKFDGVAMLAATVLTPLSAAQAREAGMSIKRTFWLLRPDGRELLAPGTPVAQGQHVFVELTVDAQADDCNAWRSLYYVVEDSVPAGFVPLSEDKRFRSAPHELPLAHESLKYRSFSPEHVQLFLEEPTWWSRSPRSLGYVMRAQFTGTFQVPPARISDMYAPRHMAQTGADSLVVAPTK